MSKSEVNVGELDWRDLDELGEEEDEDEGFHPKERFMEDGELDVEEVKESMLSWAREVDSVLQSKKEKDNPEKLKGPHHEWLSYMHKECSENFFLFMRGAVGDDRGRQIIRGLYEENDEFKQEIWDSWMPVSGSNWFSNVNKFMFDNKDAFMLVLEHGMKGPEEDPKEYEVSDYGSARGNKVEEEIDEEEDDNMDEGLSESHDLYRLHEVGVVDDNLNVNVPKLRGVLLAFAKDVDEIAGTKMNVNVRNTRSAFQRWAKEKFGQDAWIEFSMNVLEQGELQERVEWMYEENDDFRSIVEDKYTYDPEELSGNGDDGADDDNEKAPENLEEWKEKEGRAEDENGSKKRKKGLSDFESDKKETVVVDGYCGAGGVGVELDELGIKHIGIDIEDRSDTYPGKFIQGDMSDVEWLKEVLSEIRESYRVVLWLSPPCKAYTRANNEPIEERKEKFPTFDDLNVYEVADEIADEYIVENVATCDDFRGDVTKINGWAFGEDFCWERHFDTSFHCPNMKANQGSNDYIALSGAAGDDCVGENEMARAKGVPEEWGKYEIRSAIPPVYVKYLLSKCPITDVEEPETVGEEDFGKIDSWSKTHGTKESTKGFSKDVQKNKILHGAAREKLQEIPGNSIDTVMTSPPYWSVRDYGDEVVSIFGGDGDCDHEWKQGSQMSMSGGTDKSGVEGHFDNRDLHFDTKNEICQQCGAWRGQLGHEAHPDLFVKHLADVFDKVRRVLKKGGSLWVNIDDTYSGGGGVKGQPDDWESISAQDSEKYPEWKPSSNVEIPEKSLCMVPERFAIEMINRGWVLRNKVIWAKQAIDKDDVKDGVSLPTSAQDRMIEKSWEYLYHFAPKPRYQYDLDNIAVAHSQATLDAAEQGGKAAEKYVENDVYGENALNPENIREGGANIPTVWRINPSREQNDHFAPYPEKLCERPIKATCPEDGIVLDPFAGTGTTLKVASDLGRNYLGIEMGEDYIEYAKQKIGGKVIQ